MKTTICAAALALLLGTACYGQKRMSQPAAASGASCESVYDVRDFGAKGDGKADDTKAIQSALDHAIDHGGGTVYFPTAATAWPRCRKTTGSRRT
ncbi:MAG: glycosyl hydrolase family 28-related protein [Alistipes sp.]